jgi:hypothetical protein
MMTELVSCLSGYFTNTLLTQIHYRRGVKLLDRNYKGYSVVFARMEQSEHYMKPENFANFFLLLLMLL